MPRANSKKNSHKYILYFKGIGMSIIINKNNYLKNNLLIRDGYIAIYNQLERNYNIDTIFSGGSILSGNWNKNYWSYSGIQKSHQKFEQKMIELRKPIMDEKWFAIILLHLTNWEHKSPRVNMNESYNIYE